MNRKKTIAIIFLVLFVFTFMLNVYEHEKVHQKIFQAYGVKSEIEFNLLSARTVSEPITLSQEERRQMNSMHAVNEMVSYQFGVMYAFITGMLIIMYTWGGNIEVKEYQQKSKFNRQSSKNIVRNR